MRSRVWRDCCPSRDSVGLVSRPSAASALARAEREPGPSVRIAKRHIVSALHRVAPGSRIFARALRSLVRDTKDLPPTSGSMFSRSAWHKKRLAENAEYREKIRAARRRYRETHKEEMRERRRLRLQNDPDFRERERARGREWQRRKRYSKVSTGSRWSITTPCASGRMAPAPSASDPARRCVSIIATRAARCAGSSAVNATACSAFAATAPRVCWRPPRTCGRRVIRRRQVP